jgi:hypothetical protein
MGTGATGCFLNINGTVHAIVNWRSRSHKDDVIIGCRLTKAQEAQYAQMKGQGAGEAAICDRLFPQSVLPRSRPTVRIDIDVLTKGQLLQLIRERIGKPLPTLEKVSRLDLKSILAACS